VANIKSLQIDISRRSKVRIEMKSHRK